VIGQGHLRALRAPRARAQPSERPQLRRVHAATVERRSRPGVETRADTRVQHDASTTWHRPGTRLALS
jgi:hypothetical protein